MGRARKKLEIGVDWFSGIFQVSTFGQVVKNILQLDYCLFVKRPAKKLHKTYTIVYEFGDIKIYAEPENPEQRGCQLEMSGQGCNQFSQFLSEQGRSWQDFFKSCHEVESWQDFHVTRIDIAVDDRNEKPYFTLEQLARKVERKEYITRSTSHKVIKDDFEEAYTIYIGERRSELYYRIYEKNKEQAKKSGLPVESFGNWNRVEIEMKRELAKYFVSLMAQGHIDFKLFILDLLNEKLRFVVPDDNQQNKSRLKTWRPWERFLGDVKELKLEINRETNTLSDTYKWLQDGGILGIVKGFRILEENDALGNMEGISRLVDQSEISDGIYAKMVTHLTEIGCLEILPMIRKEAKNKAYSEGA